MLEFPIGISQYSFPTLIDFGNGARRNIAGSLSERGLSKPMIVTDEGLANLPPVEDVRNLLEASQMRVTVFSGVVGNPVKSQVSAGVDAYRASGSDCIVALGGGAPVDVAKAIALMAHHPGDLFDYEDGKEDARVVDLEVPYLVAVPTTAGTGSEVGRSAVVSDDESHIKKIIFSPRLLPQQVFADPELTLGLPASLTAATGMDALTHLIEAFLAPGFHPMCDGIALEGIRLVTKSLKQCVDYGSRGGELDMDDQSKVEEILAARGWMLSASIMGAVAFQKGLGVTHSCAHALSTVCDLHHGLANGIMIPYAMAFNEPEVPEKFERLSELVKETHPSFLAWLEELREDVGLPQFLGDVGVSLDKLDELVECAMKDPCHQLNPRVVSREDMRSLFVSAMGQQK